MGLDPGRLLLLATRVVPRLPGWLSAAAFRTAADLATLARLQGVRRLEDNLRRAAPWAQGRAMRRLVRDAMRSYLRYYEEALRLPSVGPEQLGQRVRVIGYDAVRAHLATGRPVVVAVGHTGNWDLAGAWSGQFLAHVITVAEHLEPEEVFRSFLDFRQGLGMTIVPLAEDGSTFRQLLRLTRGEVIVPLLADRDLSRHGVEVELFGEPARVAAGPANLALATGSPLVPAHIHYERLRGARRQAAGARWGIVIDFAPAIAAPDGAVRSHAAHAMTQAWVDAVAQRIATHPQGWHMLQPVFVADLDPDRLQPAAAGG